MIRLFFSPANSWQLAASRRFIQIALPLAPLIVVMMASAPGIYTPDSDDQLAQAMAWRFDDWHPPVMSGLWAVLLRVTGTPASLFWLQLGVIAAGVVVWSVVLKRWEVPAGTHLLLLGLVLPTSLGFIGVLWKDVGMASCLFTATGLIALAGVLDRRWRWLLKGIAVMLLLYGLLVRANSLPAILPLVLLLALGEGRLRPILATLVSALVILGVYLAASRALQIVLKVENRHPFQYLMLYDLAGIAKLTSDSRVPDLFKTENFSPRRLSENYRQWTGNYLFIPYDGFPSPPLKFRKDQQDVLFSAWLGGIVAHPREYLEHRWRIFAALMNRPALLDALPAVDRPTNSRVGSPLPGRSLAIGLVKQAIDTARTHTLLYNGWFWLGILLMTTAAGLLGARRHPGGRIAAGLGASGLLYLVPYILVSPATDFRYLYWCCIAGMMGSVILAGMLLVELRRRTKALSCWNSVQRASGLA